MVCHPSFFFFNLLSFTVIFNFFDYSLFLFIFFYVLLFSIPHLLFFFSPQAFTIFSFCLSEDRCFGVLG